MGRDESVALQIFDVTDPCGGYYGIQIRPGVFLEDFFYTPSWAFLRPSRRAGTAVWARTDLVLQ